MVKTKNLSMSLSNIDINVPRAGSPGYKNVPRAGSPWDKMYLGLATLLDINVPRAPSPWDINVPRAVSPAGHKCT